jgi:hypothetical protein
MARRGTDFTKHSRRGVSRLDEHGYGQVRRCLVGYGKVFLVLVSLFWSRFYVARDFSFDRRCSSFDYA